ncbi:MAG: tRNA pseudouridine(55) synthase TruB [Clostridia bacterium]|nr:tRNA pseudouridine(55) synthase TruB [Clostridia bacterium]
MAKKPDTACGVIVIDKHEGVTSFRIISILKKMFDMPNVGHTGTLDPLATGVLPVLLGRAVKACDYVMAQDKRYTAELKLGLTTDTEDITGEVLTTCPDIPDADRVREVISSFVGEIMQTPPMYSAIKVGGQKLVDIAREGGEVDRKPRPVTIHSIDAEQISADTWRLDVACSKGTYIRTLCSDIGRELGCGGVMSALRRTETGSFSLDDAYTIEELEKMSFEERLTLPLPVESLFEHMRAVQLPKFFANLYLAGAPLMQKKVRINVPAGEKVRVKYGNVFLGVGIGAEDKESAPILKAEKLFYLGKVE